MHSSKWIYFRLYFVSGLLSLANGHSVSDRWILDKYDITSTSRKSTHNAVPYDLEILHRTFGSSNHIRGPDIHATLSDKVVQLSWKPRAFLYEGFLTDEECNHLILKATPQLERSFVADNINGKSVLSDIRTSSGMFFNKGEDLVISGIEERIAKWTFLPKENGEAIQVLRYETGQKYDAHYDYFSDPENQQMGGHRYATVLMYLSDVKSGGETVFPNAEPAKEQKGSSWSSCGKGGLGVKPKKGDALLFFSMKTNVKPDEYSLHTACPVLEGVKWSATKWIHVDPFERKTLDSSKCENEDPRCDQWALAGECLKNPTYMVGDTEFVGSCRKACHMCSDVS